MRSTNSSGVMAANCASNRTQSTRSTMSRLRALSFSRRRVSRGGDRSGPKNSSGWGSKIMTTEGSPNWALRAANWSMTAR